jgi:hypothetical protein
VKRIHRHVPEVPQAIADRGTEIIERLFAAYGVSRASDLPEEGKVRLHRELSAFFEREMPEGLPIPDPNSVGWRGWLQRFYDFLTGG